ncbi:hypothetical protein N9E07_05130 [Planktomarina temperata]|nr:hypothetical protein [Planktomarina temperata]
MTDFFAQSLQAFQERMRTPWIGSILIAFLLWNWQPLLFLVASDTALVTRFTYFESHTGWCSLFVGPVIAGFLFAAAKPWISLVMDWLGAKAIHRSRLRADRLAADRRSKQLEQQKNLAKEEGQIENEVIDQVMERSKKNDEAQLDEDQKEQLQQKLRALQPTPEEQDVDPIDEDLLRTAIFHQLSDKSKEILRTLAQLDDGLGLVVLFNDDLVLFDDGLEDVRLQIIDPKSGRKMCNLRLNVKRELTRLEKYKLVTIRDPNLYKITDLGRKVASLSEDE